MTAFQILDAKYVEYNAESQMQIPQDPVINILKIKVLNWSLRKGISKAS